MPDNVLFQEWRAANATTNYPFSDSVSMTNGKRTLSQGIFLDAALWPVGVTGPLYLSRVVVGQTSITVYVGDDETPDLAHGTYNFPVTSPTVTLTDAYGRPAGTLVSEPDRLAVLAGWGAGDYSFDADQTEFVASVCFPQPASAVRGVLLDDGTLLDGEIWIVGDDGVALRHEQVTRPDGTVQDVVRVDIVGDPLFRRRLCFPLDLFATPRFLQELVITDGRQFLGLSPDSAGGVKLTVNNDLAKDTVLRVRSSGTEIVIEAVGNTGAFLPLEDALINPTGGGGDSTGSGDGGDGGGTEPPVYSLSLPDPIDPVDPPPPPPPPPTGSVTVSRMGVNLEQADYFHVSQYFIDIMRTAEYPWGSVTQPASSGSGPAVDANLWPLGDVGILLWSNQANMNGDYLFSFKGRATITNSSFTIVNQLYDQATNTTQGTLRYSSSATGNGYIGFKNTSRNDGSGQGGITNFKLLRPGYTSDAQIFTNKFLAMAAPFGTFRFMDILCTNNSLVTNWEDRTKVTDASWAPQKVKKVLADGYTHTCYTNTGWPYEIIFEFMRQTGKDVWINLPAHATGHYLDELAALAKSLVPTGQHMYFEYANEVWNSQFEAHDYNITQANAQVKTDSYLANYSTVKNQDHYGWCRTAEQAILFKALFGYSDPRFRAVYASQVGYSPHGYQAGVAFTYIEAKYGAGQFARNFWAVAGAPYFGGANPEEVFVSDPSKAHYEYDSSRPGVYPPKYGVTSYKGKTVTSTYPTGSVFVNGYFIKRWDRDDLTPQMVASGILGNAQTNGPTDAVFTDWHTWAVNHGVKYVCYEGGVDITQSTHSFAAKSAGQRLPDTGQAVTYSVGGAIAAGMVDIYNYFNLCKADATSGYWGLTTTPDDLTQAKYVAAKAIAQAHTF